MKKKTKYLIGTFTVLGVTSFIVFGLLIGPRESRTQPIFCLQQHVDQVNNSIDIAEAEIQTSETNGDVCLYKMQIHNWLLKSGKRPQPTLMIMENESPLISRQKYKTCKSVGETYIVLLGEILESKYSRCNNSYIVEPSEKEEVLELINKRNAKEK